jgi:hypothetical protein
VKPLTRVRIEPKVPSGANLCVGPAGVLYTFGSAARRIINVNPHAELICQIKVILPGRHVESALLSWGGLPGPNHKSPLVLGRHCYHSAGQRLGSLRASPDVRLTGEVPHSIDGCDFRVAPLSNVFRRRNGLPAAPTSAVRPRTAWQWVQALCVRYVSVGFEGIPPPLDDDPTSIAHRKLTVDRRLRIIVHGMPSAVKRSASS